MAAEPPENTAEQRGGYVFVCYSHADQDAITPDIEWLQTQGHEVWYDAHIPGGAEWNDELAMRIQNCTWFLYFVSPRSVQSPHCRNELNYAQQHGRRILAVEIEETDVPAGLQLMLNARQTLFRHKLSKGEFRRRLAAALSAVGQPEIRTLSTPKPRPKRFARWGVGVAALALALIAALVVFLPDRATAPEPAIAFGERDWVVVGNLQNRTEDPQLGEALESALRIALEQSRYASILPAATLRAAKQRMQLDPDAPLDREAAIELAQREDAKAGIVGDISALGGSYTITVEMIDPANGATVSVNSARADTRDDLLPAIDDISRQVRERLGESLSSIEASSLPLAKVTTSNLEALRAYSLGEKAVASGDWEAGLELFKRALEIDPDFAMAHGKMAAVYIAYAQQPERAAEHYEMALQNKSRLSPREQLYIEASSAWHKTPEEMRKAWKSMTALYPNEAVGFNNLGEVLKRYYLDFEGAEAQYRASTERRAPWLHVSYYNLAQSLLAQNRAEEALEMYRASYDLENNPILFSMSDALVVMGRHEEALEYLDSAGRSGAPGLKQAAQLRYAAVYADRGELDAALDVAERMLENASSPGQASRAHAARVALLEGLGDQAGLEAALGEALAFERTALEQGSDLGARSVLGHLQILARVAWRSGATDLAEEAVAVIRERVPGNGFPIDQAWYELLQAEIDLQQGDPDAALEHARRSINHGTLFQAHETLARIHAARGDAEARTEALKWMRDNRGRAFAEAIDWSYGQLFNILDWARANQALANG